MRYDPRIIVEMADRLYDAADTVEWSYALAFGVLGAAAGFALGFVLPNHWIPTIAGVLVVGGIGYWIGQQRAFSLRLHAQLMLVNVQIEANTRPSEATNWVPQPGKDSRAAANRISGALNR
jgi:hypothetical protein